MELMLPCRIKCLFVVVIFIFACIHFTRAEIIENYNLKYVIKVKHRGKQNLFRHFKKFNLTKLYRITPSTYIFEYSGPHKPSDIISSIFGKERYYNDMIVAEEPVREYKGNLRPVYLKTGELSRKETSPWLSSIVAVEPVREYKNTLRPVYSKTGELSKKETSPWLSSSNLVCDNYYGMGVPGAWSLGYTGRGVTVAVTDVGVNTELEDLKDNINTELCYNFVDKNNDVTPELFYNIKSKASAFTDHGNKVTSIMAATKGNNLCSAGIAHNATIVALKIYRVKLDQYIPQLEPSHWTSSDTIARALAHERDTIDIYANAWAPTEAFDALDMATREAIKHGAKHGRRGFGNIHVVPSGPPGNELSNNIYTITVNSIGTNGTVPEYTHVDASVLTSGLGDGNNLTSSSMVTTTLNNNCVTDLNGVSAATSQIAAIIALAIQANFNLSLRSIQHLLVHASDKKGLQEERAFRKNAAGKYFHDVFGFGQVDAEKLVNLSVKSVKQQPLPDLLQKTLNTYTKRPQNEHTQLYTFCYSCKNVKKKNCLTTIEHVLVKMNPTSTSDDIKVELKSPGGTVSLLIDYTSRQKFKDVKNMKLVSVHFWGEPAFGRWSLIVRARKKLDSIDLTSLSLTLTGTNNEPIPHFRGTKSYVCDTGKSRVNDEDSALKKPTTDFFHYPETDETRNEIYALLCVFIPIILIAILGVCKF